MVALSPAILATTGMYTVDQVSKLARVRPATIRSWLEPTSSRGPAVKRYLEKNDLDVFGFVDLVQLVAVRSVRKTRPVPLARLRAAAAAAEKLGREYPFACDVRVFSLDRDVVLKFPDGTLIGASGQLQYQHLMEPILQPYLHELTFGPDGLATEFRPLKGVLLSPSRAFGAPVIESCGYTVSTLVESYYAEGDTQRAADVCGVTVEDVELALKYEDVLAGEA